MQLVKVNEIPGSMARCGQCYVGTTGAIDKFIESGAHAVKVINESEYNDPQHMANSFRTICNRNYSDKVQTHKYNDDLYLIRKDGVTFIDEVVE